MSGLASQTRYRYEIRARSDGRSGKAVRGSFSTAPAATTQTPVRIAWSGDFAGQNVCRDAVDDMPLLKSVADADAGER